MNGRPLHIMGRAVILLIAGWLGPGATIPSAAPATGAAGTSGAWHVLVPAGDLPALFRPASIAIGRQGSIDVLDQGDRAIKRLSAAGRVVTGWNGPLVDSPVIASDGQGRLYGAAHGQILQVSSAGTILSRWSGPQLAGSPVSIAVGAGGNISLLYRDLKNQKVIAGNFRARIVKLSPRGRVLATWSTDEAGLDATFPQTIAVDRQGNIYVSIFALNHCTGPHDICQPDQLFFIHELSPAGRLIQQWGGNMCCGLWRSTGWLLFAGVDAAGNLYLTDPQHALRVSPQGQVTASWNVIGCTTRSLWDGLAAAVDMRGTVYIAQTWMWHHPGSEDFGLLQRLTAGSPSGVLAGSCAAPSTGLTDPPTRLAVDGRGNLYVAMQDSSRVLKVWPAGSTQALDTREAGVSAIAADRAGILYLALPRTHQIEKWSPQGRLLATWKSLPPPPAMQHDVLVAQHGLFDFVVAMCIDALGRIYLASNGGSRLEILSPSGSVESQWKWGLPSGQHLHGEPTGVTNDRAGNLDVADNQGYVTKVSPDGAVLNIRKLSAQSLLGIAVDTHGDVYALVERQGVVEYAATG